MADGRCAAVVAWVAGLALAAPPKLPGQEVATRRTTTADFAYPVERWVAPNGLVVLMSPDPAVHQVVVDLTFNAGALYEPATKSGLAHLTEHALSSGDSPDTDYRALLEASGALEFNGSTTPDHLAWRLVVPPEALPLALWANAERLGTLPAQLTPEALARHRRIVLQERLMRLGDAAYGSAEVAIMARLFPAGHPLHLGVLGTPSTLQAITVEDVRAFAATFLVPKNAVLTLTGRFEPAVAKDWVGRTLGRLPPGAPAAPPPATPTLGEDVKVKIAEALGRRPRVSLAWTLDQPFDEVNEALTFGAALLAVYTDGLVGMRVAADFVRYRAGALFVLNVTLPHEVDMLEAGGNAEVVYRFLSKVPMPVDLVVTTFHVLDRLTLARLASPAQRAALLTDLERNPPSVVQGYSPLDRHWRLTPLSLQAQAASALKGGRLTLQVRPTRPLPRKAK